MKLTRFLLPPCSRRALLAYTAAMMLTSSAVHGASALDHVPVGDGVASQFVAPSNETAVMWPEAIEALASFAAPGGSYTLVPLSKADACKENAASVVLVLNESGGIHAVVKRFEGALADAFLARAVQTHPMAAFPGGPMYTGPVLLGKGYDLVLSRGDGVLTATYVSIEDFERHFSNRHSLKPLRLLPEER